MNSKLRVALCISGGGTTMQEILRAARSGILDRVDPVLVIASKPEAGGIEKALAEGIDPKNVVVIPYKEYGRQRSDDFGRVILEKCRERGVDFVGQYGWLPLMPVCVIDAYPGSIVNQHPGPLDPGRPDFGGIGMYGRAVHCARLFYVHSTAPKEMKLNTSEYEEYYYTEVVTHHVASDSQYDQGELIAVKKVLIHPHDDTFTLQARALREEHALQIAVLKAASEGNLPKFKRAEPLVPEHLYDALTMAKRNARLAFPKG